MSMSNCARLARKYSWHWNRKLLSLLGSVLLKVSGMWALVPLELVLGPGVWLELRVLASWLSILANCSLVLSLWRGLDCERVEEVSKGSRFISYIISTRISRSILPIRIIVRRNNTWARNRWNCLARLDCTGRRLWRWTASLMDSSWTSWRIWQISHLVTETRDRVEGCPKCCSNHSSLKDKWSHN